MSLIACCYTADAKNTHFFRFIRDNVIAKYEYLQFRKNI